MNKQLDVNALLAASAAPRPRRPLKADFTEHVIGQLRARPRPGNRLAALYMRLKLNLLPKPMLAVFGGIVVLGVGGSGYAMVINWLNPSAHYAGQQALPSGNRIVSVDTANCMYFEGLEGQPQRAGKQTVYYEIRQDSPLTNQQVADMVQGICEENVGNNAVSHAMKDLAPNMPGVFSTENFIVQSIDTRSLTVTFDPHYDARMRTTKLQQLSFNRFDNALKLYDGMLPAGLSAFKPGDAVRLIIRSDSPKSTEAAPASPLHLDGPYGDMGSLVVVAIVKTPPLTGHPDVFYTHLGVDFVRADPCKTSPSGFCRAYDFIHQNNAH